VGGRVGHEQPADEPGQRVAVFGRQEAEEVLDIGLEARRDLRDERPARFGEADPDGPSVLCGGNTRDEAAPFRAVDQPAGAANLRIQGNGQGAVSTEGYLAELPSLVDEIAGDAIAVKANTIPLADVEEIWPRADPPGERTVLAP
jgi:hypothetical protein